VGPNANLCWLRRHWRNGLLLAYWPSWRDAAVKAGQGGNRWEGAELACWSFGCWWPFLSRAGCYNPACFSISLCRMMLLSFLIFQSSWCSSDEMTPLPQSSCRWDPRHLESHFCSIRRPSSSLALIETGYSIRQCLKCQAWEVGYPRPWKERSQKTPESPGIVKSLSNETESLGGLLYRP
jgi:hypothetical protein